MGNFSSVLVLSEVFYVRSDMLIAVSLQGTAIFFSWLPECTASHLGRHVTCEFSYVLLGLIIIIIIIIIIIFVIEALSCNLCYRGKAVIFTYSECVFVPLVIQSFYLWPVWLYHTFQH